MNRLLEHQYKSCSINPIEYVSLAFRDSMALRRLFQLSSVFSSALRGTLHRNMGISAVLFNKAKDLDPVQKLFLDKIRDYSVKSK